MSLREATWNSHAVAPLLVRQVEALDEWNVARHKRESLLCEKGASPESRVDAMRRLHVLRHAHAAVLERTGSALASEPAPLSTLAPRRAVIAHRDESFVAKLSEALEARGALVVGVSDNGAEALGIAVAEQPELIVAGETLAMMSACELLAEVALFSPYTLRAAQVARGDCVGDMLDAGAQSVFIERVSVDEAAGGLTSLLRQAT